MSLVIKSDNVLAMASGLHTTVTASDTVDTGLTEVFGVMVMLQSDPVLTASSASATIPDQVAGGGTVLIKTWMATSSSVTTPTAATTFTKVVQWVAFGK